jgi:hypothetical protein
VEIPIPVDDLAACSATNRDCFDRVHAHRISWPDRARVPASRQCVAGEEDLVRDGTDPNVERLPTLMACRPERLKSGYAIDFSVPEALDYVPLMRMTVRLTDLTSVTSTDVLSLRDERVGTG